MFIAMYVDDRDNDKGQESESTIGWYSSIEQARIEIVEYFRNSPNSLKHCMYWEVVRQSDGVVMMSGITYEHLVSHR